MKTIKKSLFPACAAAALVTMAAFSATPASASIIFGPSGVCPATDGHPAVGAAGDGNATDCNLFITFNANGSITTTSGPIVTGGAAGTYESIEDALIGVVNNTGHAITSFTLNGGANNIFGFDGDGIDLYTIDDSAGPTNIGPVSGNPDTTGYGGSHAYFTNIVGNVGTVNFANGGIAAGGRDFFSLELPASIDLRVNNSIPEPATVALMGLGLVGMGVMRRKRSS